MRKFTRGLLFNGLLDRNCLPIAILCLTQSTFCLNSTNMHSKRVFWTIWTSLFAVLAVGHCFGEQSLEERLEHARQILDKVPLVDGHNDLIMNVRTVLSDHIEDFPFEKNLSTIEPWASRSNSQTDLPRMREGKLGGQFWSVFVSCHSQYKNSLSFTLEQIDAVHRLVNKYPDDMVFVDTADGILQAHADGKIASMIGIEGGHSMDDAMGALRIFYYVGVRYMTLTHNCNTPWADNNRAEITGLEFDGLTKWGEKVVKEMNRLGMLVDLAHVAAETMRDVLDITRAPVMFSHSDARGLWDVPRNIPDDVLERLPENGGIAMVNFYPGFLAGEGSTIQDVVAHINYIRDMAGVDHVGIGSDFDGISTTPIGLEDVSKFPDLFAELLKDPKWTDEDLEKLAGLNIIRVFKEVEEARDALITELPYDDLIPPEDIAEHLDCVEPWDVD